MIRFRKAVLIIHGFTGNLYDNEYLMNYLEYEPRLDVYAKTLPGHAQERFQDCRYREWVNFVEDEIEHLIQNGYRKIYVIGHSMGGVLASIVATKYKQVKKLVLVNAAFDYFNFKQNKLDLLKNKKFDKYKGILDKAFRTSPIFIIEFTKLVKKYRNVINNIKCDTLILQSTEDEIIPLETGEFVYNSISIEKKYLTYLNGCSHVVFRGNRKYEVSEYIRVFLKGGLKWKRTMKKEL